MSVIYFVIILAALIIVHEFGHFIVAKAVGMRVDEFGIGFPPRARRMWQNGETEYTLNWLPIGGFVKIFGEDNEDNNEQEANGNDETFGQHTDQGVDEHRKFTSKPRHKQALVLVAGVVFNIVFAWLLISVGFMVGLPTPVDRAPEGQVTDPQLTITSVAADSPSAEAGLHTGDHLVQVTANGDTLRNPTSDSLRQFVRSHPDTPLAVTINRGDKTFSRTIEATKGIVEGHEAIGVTSNRIGILQLAPHRALWQGFLTTGEVTNAVVVGFGNLVYRALTGVADYSQVAGPVGIAELVGDASMLGWVYLLQFTAFISINLAVINLVPIPALDGGRLLFVAIEAIRRKPIDPRVAGTLNAAGFALLIILMIAVTYNDILRLV